MRTLRSSIWITSVSRGTSLSLCVAASSSASIAAAEPERETPTPSEGAPTSLDRDARLAASHFLLSEFDLHQSLLREAHAKHGVSLNVPPQLPPPGAPPEVPQPVYCASLAAWLQKTNLLYPPIHGAPPLASTGTRGLGDMSDTPRSAAVSPPALPSPSKQGKPSQGVGDARQTSLLSPPTGTPLRNADPTPSEAQTLPPSQSLLSSTATAPPSLAEYRKGVALTLPTDAEVEHVLAHIWDRRGAEVGGTEFVPAAAVVVGVADDRKPLSETAIQALPRATPEGAAPGVKRVASLRSVGAAVASATQPLIPLKQLSSRFPNPLGESAEAKLMARLQNEPVNPFVPLMRVDNAGVAVLPDRPGAPSLARAARRRFQCHLCDASFRLADALQDHMAEQHQIDMTPEMLVEVVGDELRRNPYVPPQGASDGDADIAGASAAKLSAGAQAGGATRGAASDGPPGSAAIADDWLPPPPVEEAAVTVHVRACSNATLLGEVVDVQQGYLKALRVTQYVLRVDADDGDDAATSTPTARGQPEFVVVRVLGDALKFTTDQVTAGSRVLVHGSLRMNRHTDTTSRRIHAYPFVQVAAPLGNLTILLS